MIIVVEYQWQYADFAVLKNDIPGATSNIKLNISGTALSRAMDNIQGDSTLNGLHINF